MFHDKRSKKGLRKIDEILPDIDPDFKAVYFKNSILRRRETLRKT